MAEAVGFEPTKHFCSLVFKTSSIGRSDRPPLSSLVGRRPLVKYVLNMPIATRILIFAFLVSGVSHLVAPELFLGIMPPILPEPKLLVYLSGIAEIVCAVGLLLRNRFAPVATALVLLAVWPANWWFAIDALDSNDFWLILVAWIRLPLQIPLIWIALKSPIKKN